MGDVEDPGRLGRKVSKCNAHDGDHGNILHETDNRGDLRSA
jgi:hypothetical protein